MSEIVGWQDNNSMAVIDRLNALHRAFRLAADGFGTPQAEQDVRSALGRHGSWRLHGNTVDPVHEQAARELIAAIKEAAEAISSRCDPKQQCQVNEREIGGRTSANACTQSVSQT